MTADDETQRQLEELRTFITAQLRTRDAHQRRLYALQEQAAHLGKNTPPEVVIEIADILEQVRALDEQLREVRAKIAKLELAPQSGLTVPTGPAVIPELIPAVVDTRLQALERGQARLEGAVDVIVDQVALSRDESREWRGAERAARQEDRRTSRYLFIAGAIVLLLLAIGVVLIAVRVY